ncbi:nitrite reductase small subunit NirD [Kocuria sediminis]|uniref:Nitrite reductase small subunit NirD n=1 Tax=Kocuria sediminis TaxID=1038857 RepID=A0A6N8GNA4_9MICC|nr:nitrite reductase small subunit NirD [Kocuria sediminis]MUN63717.1 nitrite reductase small subunit NirD [Kocuria sediminis]
MTATLPEAPTRPAGPATAWHDVCALTDLEPLWGEAARVAGRQVALYRVDATTVLAADHRDPRTGACVMARGILGSRGAAVTVASPLHKEVYDLGSGRCLSGEGPELPVHPVLVRDGRVLVALPSAPPVGGEAPGGRP